MRCALECTIEGKLKLPGRIDTPWFENKRLVIELDKDGFASLIRLEGPVSEDDMISMLVIQEPGRPPHFQGAGGEKIRRELEHGLQIIESTLGVFLRISRIRWEYATSIAIPETPEEQQQIQWNNLRVMPELEDTTRTPTMEDFESMLHMGYHARDLATTMSFFREGDTDLRIFRFITAFFSFYFVLEGLYANGQFGGREVRAEFGKSAVLRSAIERALSLPLYSRPARFKEILTVNDFLGRVNKPRDVEGVIHMLVWVRGDLHHFVNR